MYLQESSGIKGTCSYIRGWRGCLEGSWTIYEMILGISLTVSEVTVVLFRAEGLILLMETLIRKELCPRSSSPRLKDFLSIGWRESMWILLKRRSVTEQHESTQKILNAHRSRRWLLKVIIQEPPFWKDSFLCRTLPRSSVNVQMHFKWKPWMTCKLIAVAFLLWECLSNTKRKLFYQPLEVMSTLGLAIYSRAGIKVGSPFVACPLNSGASSTSPLHCPHFFWCETSVTFPFGGLLVVLCVCHQSKGRGSCSVPFISLHEFASVSFSLLGFFFLFYVLFRFCTFKLHLLYLTWMK